MTLPARAALTALALASVSACASAQARPAVPPPPLDMPAPPARMLVPAPPLDAVVEPAPAPVPANTPTPVKPSPPASRPPDRSTPPPATPQTSPPPDSPPPPVLQTTQNSGEQEQRARTFIDQAQKNLAKIDPRSLGREPRDQYEQAKRFIELALDQIAIKNFVRALQLAENAAALAGQLVK